MLQKAGDMLQGIVGGKVHTTSSFSPGMMIWHRGRVSRQRACERGVYRRDGQKWR